MSTNPPAVNQTLRGGAIPLVLTYRRVTKRPEIRRHRQFVGVKRVLGTLLHRALDWVDNLAYETTQETLDAGEVQVVHWAVQVEDPWNDMRDRANLSVSRVADCPPCGLNFEIMRIEPQAPAEPAEAATRPENHAEARARMRAMLLKKGHFDPEAGPPPDDESEQVVPAAPTTAAPAGHRRTRTA